MLQTVATIVSSIVEYNTGVDRARRQAVGGRTGTKLHEYRAANAYDIFELQMRRRLAAGPLSPRKRRF